MAIASSSSRSFALGASSFSRQQLENEALQVGFTHQTRDLRSLAAMTLASGAFSLTRALGTSLFSSVVQGSALRSTSFFAALLVEVGSFRSLHQAFNPNLSNVNNSPSFSATLTDFLFLKGAGIFCRAQPLFINQSLQASAMVGGEYAGEKLRLRESSHRSLGERYAHAFSTSIAMGVGAHLVFKASGGYLQRLQMDLDSRVSQATLLRSDLNLNTRGLDSMAAEKKPLSLGEEVQLALRENGDTSLAHRVPDDYELDFAHTHLRFATDALARFASPAEIASKLQGVTTIIGNALGEAHLSPEARLACNTMLVKRMDAERANISEAEGRTLQARAGAFEYMANVGQIPARDAARRAIMTEVRNNLGIAQPETSRENEEIEVRVAPQASTTPALPGSSSPLMQRLRGLLAHLKRGPGGNREE